MATDKINVECAVPCELCGNPPYKFMPYDGMHIVVCEQCTQELEEESNQQSLSPTPSPKIIRK